MAQTKTPRVEVTHKIWRPHVAPEPLRLTVMLDALKLRTAARTLVSVIPSKRQDARLAIMAELPPTQWTTEQIIAARDIIGAYRDDLDRVGFDTTLLPAPPGHSTTSSLTTDAGGGVAEFDYDHTIDGLRGIPVSELDEVNGKAAERLVEYGLRTVYDLLSHVPLRYLDRSITTPIGSLKVGETGTTLGKVTRSTSGVVGSGMRVARISVDDGTGRIECTFFNQAWRAKMFNVGDEVVLQGRLSEWTDGDGTVHLQMTNPLLDRTGSETMAIIPIYPQSKQGNVTTWQIQRAAMEAVQRMGRLADPVPAELLAAHELMGRQDAYVGMHLPTSPGVDKRARARLAYDELLRMQLALQMRRAAEQAQGGITHEPTGVLTRALIESLPFRLTGAQGRSLTAIAAAMRRPTPMHTLLQGDVGSGKTLVAATALLMAVEGGYQGALMAPTEVLASQHHQELVERIGGLTRPDGTSVKVAALTNKVRSAERRETLAGLADGSIDIVVGTHAVLTDDVTFANLGLAVVDEQHRFGVEQRASLASKGQQNRPDMLVMTATPIPRTAAMTVFGDLDVTVLDELPPGRTPIDTVWEPDRPDMDDPHDRVWAQVRAKVAQGRQAYVVCPLVEDSETKAAASAESTRTSLAAGALADLRIGLVHGKQKPAERDEVMAAFKAGEIDVLVATTVIEVGVNVPNAAIIVILEPKQFGIAQLHQLRGRVGRGQHPSTCVLAGPASSSETEQRLNALEAITDGFKLAEVDLKLRGFGSILGTDQAGLSDLRVASLATDTALLQAARTDAAKILDGDPGLARRPGLRAEVANALGNNAADYLTAS